MNTPIYRLFFHNTLPDAPGARRMLACRCGWSNAAYRFFGVDLYPSLSALAGSAEDMGGESFLALPMDATSNGLNPPSLPRAGETPIYRIYLSRLTPHGTQMAPDALEDVWARGREKLGQVGGMMVLSGYTRWNNETWDGFGVERFSCPEALIEYSQFLTTNGWYRLTEARSCLGTAVGGEITR